MRLFLRLTIVPFLLRVCRHQYSQSVVTITVDVSVLRNTIAVDCVTSVLVLCCHHCLFNRVVSCILFIFVLSMFIAPTEYFVQLILRLTIVPLIMFV